MLELRKRRGWSQEQLSELLKTSMGRGSVTMIRRWEKSERTIPQDIGVFLGELALEERFPTDRFLGDTTYEEPPEGSPDPTLASGDSAPPPPPTSAGGQAAGQLPLHAGGGVYARVCEELWELIATSVGMVGAVTGSKNLQADGRIILADKEALGKAWGKLAETNDTFRRMLTSLNSSGAWLEVALVTGITAGKVMRNHQQPELPASTEGNGDGEGRVVPFASAASELA